MLRRYSPILLAVLMLSACDDFDPAPVNFDQSDIVIVGDVPTLELRGRVLAALPEEGPQVDPDKRALGRLLFWDPILSGDQDVACATCHLPEHGYGDGLPQSIGVGGVDRGPDRVVGHTGLVQRNAQSVLNTAWNGINELGAFDASAAPMFWDNRVQSLAEQAIEPLLSREEMRGDTLALDAVHDELAQRLSANADYVVMFSDVYGDAPITTALVADALAAFQTTLVANNSPYDRWMRGEADAMTGAEISGMQEFVIAGCADCHSGPMFSDFEPHVLGLAEGQTGDTPDSGDGTFAFRTPGLRQLSFTAPYFHAGQAATLAAAVDFYDERRQSDNPHVSSSQLDPDLLDVPEMDDGRGAAIIRFLDALNDPEFDQSQPESVPSGLPVGGFSSGR